MTAKGLAGRCSAKVRASLGPFRKETGLPVLNECYGRARQQLPLRMTCHFVSQLQEERRGSSLTGDDGVT